jgi:hypothetical protein
MFRNVQRKLGVILLGCAAATTGLVLTKVLPAGADTVAPTYLGRAPQTSELCGNGFSILKFTNGSNFDAGLHTDQSSGDPTSTATFTTATTTLSLSSVVVAGQPAIVQSVIIGNNGAGNAYQWNYGGGIVPTVANPLVHTSSSATPLINPMTGNQYFFCMRRSLCHAYAQ